MFYGILIFIHIFVCIGLIIIVLIQAGRGGGLAESFSGAESIFGTKTNTFLTRATMLFAIVFLATCLALAFLSKQRSRSIMAAQKIITTETQKKEEKQKQETAETQKATPKTPADTQTEPTQTQEPLK